jgi:uncharacterized protein (DUF169 family)
MGTALLQIGRKNDRFLPERITRKEEEGWTFFSAKLTHACKGAAASMGGSEQDAAPRAYRVFIRRGVV